MVHLEGKVKQPYPILLILVLIQKGDLFKFQQVKPVFSIKREKKNSN